MMIGGIYMNSIEFTGKLSESKQKLYDNVKKNGHKNWYESCSERSSSYWLNYKDSKHLASSITVYDSYEISLFRHNLSDLWNNDETMKSIQNILMEAYYINSKGESNYLQQVDLYNYMM